MITIHYLSAFFTSSNGNITGSKVVCPYAAKFAPQVEQAQILSFATTLAQTFDRDAAIEPDGPDFKTNTVRALFENDTVVPTEDLLEILSRSEQISLEDELRENIALLVVPTASETQMDQVLESQQSLESELGGVEQIANTDIEELEAVFAEYEIEDSGELAEGVRDEAVRLNEVLD